MKFVIDKRMATNKAINIFLTSSADATIRLWDIYGKQFAEIFPLL